MHFLNVPKGNPGSTYTFDIGCKGGEYYYSDGSWKGGLEKVI